MLPLDLGTIPQKNEVEIGIPRWHGGTLCLSTRTIFAVGEWRPTRFPSKNQASVQKSTKKTILKARGPISHSFNFRPNTLPHATAGLDLSQPFVLLVLRSRRKIVGAQTGSATEIMEALLDEGLAVRIIDPASSLRAAIAKRKTPDTDGDDDSRLISTSVVRVMRIPSAAAVKVSKRRVIDDTSDESDNDNKKAVSEKSKATKNGKVVKDMPRDSRFHDGRHREEERLRRRPRQGESYE